MLRHLGSKAPHGGRDGGQRLPGAAANAAPGAKPWVLKTPYYSAMLADLVAEYPNARVVMTHRRPVQAMASLNALQMKLRSVTSDKASPLDIANETFAQWDVFARRAVEVREAWSTSASCSAEQTPRRGRGVSLFYFMYR